MAIAMQVTGDLFDKNLWTAPSQSSESIILHTPKNLSAETKKWTFERFSIFIPGVKFRFPSLFLGGCIPE